MALFKRSELESKGFTADQIDYLMAESGKYTATHLHNDDVQKKINEAIEDFKSKLPEPVKVQDTEEYKKLLLTNEKLTAFSSDDFNSVKKPYKDIVWDKLDHAENHKAYKEQLGELQKSMPDLFSIEEPEEPKKPMFGAPTQGSVPSGDKGKAFGDYWGFAPKKG